MEKIENNCAATLLQAQESAGVDCFPRRDEFDVDAVQFIDDFEKALRSSCFGQCGRRQQ
jgi:hypothetical protein